MSPKKVEEKYFENKCRKSIIDFEFLLDSSGSIQEENWDDTVQAIGNHWIDSPLLADNCGNRVAGRRFSNERDEYQVKFHAFGDYSAMVKMKLDKLSFYSNFLAQRFHF